MSMVVVIVFGAGIAALLGMAAYYHSRANSARRNMAFLDRVGGMMESPGGEIDASDHRPTRLAKSKAIREMLKDAPFTADLADLLEQSGLKTTVAGLITQMVIGFLIANGLALALKMQVAAGFFLGLLLAVVPMLFVVRARNQRASAFEAQLPHALELIGLYLRSGRSLPQAFIGATEEILPPASEEFFLTAEEYRLGRPLDASLKRLAAKYPTSLGFRLFAIAVSVLGQTGGNLVEVLERIKKTLDAGVQYGLRLKALTGESRMSAWILGCLPGIFMAITGILNPSYVNNFFDYTIGRVLFGLFLALWGSGIFWIRKLMQSKLV